MTGSKCQNSNDGPMDVSHNTFMRTSRGYIDASGPDSSFSLGEWSYTPYPDSVCSNGATPDTSIAVVSTVNGVEAFTTESTDASCPDSVVYIPHGDGHSYLPIADHNDHARIESRLDTALDNVTCAGVPSPSSFCGSL